MDLLGFFSAVMETTATAVTSSQIPVQAGTPFPSHIAHNTTDKKALPVMSLWQSSRSSGKIVESLADRCQKIKLAKLHRFTEAGLEQDEFESIIEDLHQLSEAYKKPSDAM